MKIQVAQTPKHGRLRAFTYLGIWWGLLFICGKEAMGYHYISLKNIRFKYFVMVIFI